MIESNISEFNLRINEFTYPDQIDLELTDTLKSLGYSMWAYQVLYYPKKDLQPTTVSIRGNYSNTWVDRYIAKNYVTIDPITNYGYRNLLPYIWSDIVDVNSSDRGVQKIFSESREFGLDDGLSISIILSTNCKALMTLIPEEKIDFTKKIQDDYLTIHSLCMTFNDRIQTISPWFKDPIVGFHLTNREVECLWWAAQGKSAWSTAKILGVSERTVVYHIENSKKKLNSDNITQAVATAINLKILEI